MPGDVYNGVNITQKQAGHPGRTDRLQAEYLHSSSSADPLEGLSRVTPRQMVAVASGVWVSYSKGRDASISNTLTGRHKGLFDSESDLKY